MKHLEEKELLAIVGGFNITGVLINAFTNATKFIYEMGRNFGSSIRRISGNNLCPLR